MATCQSIAHTHLSTHKYVHRYKQVRARVQQYKQVRACISTKYMQAMKYMHAYFVLRKYALTCVLKNTRTHSCKYKYLHMHSSTSAYTLTVISYLSPVVASLLVLTKSISFEHPSTISSFDLPYQQKCVFIWLQSECVYPILVSTEHNTHTHTKLTTEGTFRDLSLTLAKSLLANCK